MEPEYLFVYGTLLKDSNHEMAKFLEAHSECVGNGYFYGKLYRVSWYPGAVLSDDPSQKVFGKVFKIKDADSVFKVLDDYEGVGESQPKPNLYKKELVTAFLEEGTTIKTWVYLYNLSNSGLVQITSGKFLG
ncbi:gamma-glutamylcyclotransferase family protein [Tamlana flava]|uniref:gamma-glutamylcyclotransferase family protein n=1 Tax=Tamlana flava TaxID=3158572 RepID=UPI00351B0EBB